MFPQWLELEVHTEIDTAPPAWGWRDVGIVVILVVIGALMLALLAQQLPAAEDVGLTSPVTYTAMAGVYGLLVLGVYWFAVRRSNWAAVGWRVPPRKAFAVVPGLFLIVLLGLLLIGMVVNAIMGEQFENPQVESLSGGSPFSGGELIALLVLIGVLVPVAEELFFRGMIYPLLRYRWGAGVAVVGSAAIFALVHFIPPLLPALFFIGLLLGLLREWCKSVLPGILLHGIQNSFALLAIYATLTGA